MKKPIVKLAALAGATTASCVLTVAPAQAAPSTVWTVSPSPAGVSLTNSVNLRLSVNGIAMTCTKSNGAATLRSTTGNPATAGRITSIAFGAAGAPCTTVLGNITLVPTAPWTFVAQDHTASTGVTQGYIGDIDMKLSVGAMVFRVQGKASATYTNATGRLTVENTVGELPITESANSGAAFPVGASLLIKGDYLVKPTGTTAFMTIVGTNL
ncbi:hypothetical protein O1L60_38330 [Streptomyces diastatochromogenes]|nr:hypothetical protein [Streptomyces diastatochromogenes]